jgi:hypothetical protein
MRFIAALLLLGVSLPALAADKLPPEAVAKADTAAVVKPWMAQPVLSADGKVLAVRVPGGFDLIDLTTGKAVQLRDDTGKRVLPPKTTRDSGDTMLAFALDGKTVVTANQEKCVSVWDAATGRHLRDVSMPQRKDNGSGLPPDPRYPADRVFASPHMKGLVVIGAYSLFTLNAKDEFAALDNFISGSVTHATGNGRWIASTEQAEAIASDFWVTDVSKRKAFDDTAAHFGGSVGQNRYAGRVCTSADGKLVAVTYWSGAKEKDHGVQLYRYDGTGEVKLADATGGEFAGWPALGFSGDTKTLYVASGGKLLSWDTATGKRGKDRNLPLKDSSVTFDPPRDRAIVCGDGHVYVVDLKK